MARYKNGKTSLLAKVGLSLSVLLALGAAGTALSMGVKNDGWFEDNQNGGEIVAPIEKENPLSQSVTFDRVQAVAGIAESVDFVEFNELGGDVWFITQFKGRNAPNYAVHADKGYSDWTEETAKTPASVAASGGKWDNNVDYFPFGTLIANSCENSWVGLGVYRGSNTSSSGSDKRGSVGNGAYTGMYRYDDKAAYVQIVGYEHSTGTITTYLYKEESDKLVEVDFSEKVIAAANSFVKGSTAVIYPNIGVTPTVTDEKYSAQGPKSISFTYEQPTDKLYDLIKGLSDDYAYKAQLVDTFCYEEAVKVGDLAVGYKYRMYYGGFEDCSFFQITGIEEGKTLGFTVGVDLYVCGVSYLGYNSDIAAVYGENSNGCYYEFSILAGTFEGWYSLSMDPSPDSVVSYSFTIPENATFTDFTEGKLFRLEKLESTDTEETEEESKTEEQASATSYRLEGQNESQIEDNSVDYDVSCGATDEDELWTENF